MGCKGWKEFETARAAHAQRVRAAYDRLLQVEAPSPAALLPREFEEAEWKGACAVVKRDKNAPEPSIAEFMGIVGKLGGHLGRKSDGPPGPKSIWQGLTRVKDFALAWQACHGG